MRPLSAPSLCALFAMIAAGCHGRPVRDEAPVAPPAASGTADASKAAASPKSSSSGAGTVAEIDLSKGDPEVTSASLFGPAPKRTHADLVRVLRDLARSKEGPKGLFVKLGGASTGLARALEIGQLLGEVKKTRPVVCHADGYHNATLLLAIKGCSRVWVSPAGDVDAIGIAAQLLFANKLLERLHVGVDFLQIGKYKGAEETFTRDGPSPEARETLQSALRGVRAAWLAGLTEGRGDKAIEGIVEDGPFSPEEAKDKHLVDAIGYLDDARDEAKTLSGASRVSPRFGGDGRGGGGFVGVLRAIAGSGSIGTPHVTVLPAAGAISMAPSRSSPLGGSDGITERELGQKIAKLTSDTSVRAVVLRIDSPGGSALASDLLWKKLMKLREKKPLVISVGDLAASGGYYLACAGTKIMVQPTSIVGSIGVVGGKLAVGPALEEFGVHTETIAASPDPKKGARAAYMSPFTRWDEGTKERIRVTMKAVYDLFLQRIAEGRGVKVDAIAPSAEGRLFSGLDAKERGLADAVGGLSDAIDLAISLAKLPNDTPIEVSAEDGGLLDLLGADEPRAARAPLAAAGDALPGWLAVPELAAFVGSMEPILGGERAVTSLPFAVQIR